MSFVRRFRIACRKFIEFNKRIYKKGPQYLDCNEYQSSCTRRKADPFNGCPDCEYTIQHKLFLSELDKALEDIPKTTWKGAEEWPRDYLLEQVREVASISSSKKHDPKWTVVLATLISVYRDEDAKIKYRENYKPDPPPTNKPLIPDSEVSNNPYKRVKNGK